MEGNTRCSLTGSEELVWAYLLEKFLVANIVVKMAPCWQYNFEY